MPKVRTLEQSIARDVADGMSILMGAALESLIPFAAGYELIRQKKRDLTLVTTISDTQFDQMIGAGCVRKIIGAWVGNVAAGLGHNFRRAVEQEIPCPLMVENHSNFTIALALKAGAMGVPFLPTRTLRGSDLLLENHFSDVSCPFTAEALVAVRALRPDVAILHVQKADEEGNAHVWGNLGVTQDAAMAAGKVILTCEEIVPHEEIVADPNRTLIPGFLVSSVVHLPFGSHPAPTQGYVRRDDAFYFEYHKDSRTREGYLSWLGQWVLDVKDHDSYLERLGQKRLEPLRASGACFAPSVSFNY